MPFSSRYDLFQLIKQKKSYLCVGLDTDMRRIPRHLLSASDPVFEFNRQIIDATLDYAIAYKPNLAFYEAEGTRGWESLQRTFNYLPPDVFKIADAKRGDIGNTSEMYARAFFETMGADAITVSPYMGEDSVRPFTGFAGKWVVVLAHTSNPGSRDFQLRQDSSGKKLYESVMEQCQAWAPADRLMFVVGATHPDAMIHVRTQVPEHFLLVPGVGAQGGDLEAISKAGLNTMGGLIVNASRSILYASDGPDFALAAGREARQLQEQMARLLEEHLL